ncbi:MAG: 2OG-Fe(II) oxygenase [Lysobacteraceae bacterium]
MADAEYRNITRWLVEQIRAGQPTHALLQSMSQQGWRRDIAMGLIAQAMGERSSTVEASSASSAPLLQSSTTCAPMMPGPALDGAPISLDVGDRRASVLMTLPEPKVVLFGDFLSKNECDRLVEVALPRMQRSLTTDLKTGDNKLDVVRTSHGMFFNRGESPLITAIETRIARLLAWPVEKGEHLQVLHYRPGDRYEPHYDYFDPAGDAAPTLLARGGQRVATLLMYLREPEAGGETIFPETGLRISPKRGCALFFSYDRPHPSTRTLHGGAPVIAGEKWVATKWLREGVFA